LDVPKKDFTHGSVEVPGASLNYNLSSPQFAVGRLAV